MSRPLPDSLLKILKPLDLEAEYTACQTFLSDPLNAAMARQEEVNTFLNQVEATQGPETARLAAQCMGITPTGQAR